MTTRIMLDLFADEHAAKVKAEERKSKGYSNPTIERVEKIVWNALEVTDGSRNQPNANEMWLVISRK